MAQRWPSAFAVPEVARRIGVTERTYRRWEAGEDRPRSRHLRALNRELGLNPISDSGESIEIAAGLSWLQPQMAEVGTYYAADETFRQVAIMVRNASAGQAIPPASGTEVWLRRAEQANPLDTEHGRLIQEACVLLRARLCELEPRIGHG
jgi:transcriptional regulator with XRE-family HTH domain